MRYAIVKVGRAVSLDDRLVDEYVRYGELRECVFTIGIRSRFGHWPTPEEVSDEELSKLCNELLLDELKAFALLPKAAAAVDREVKKIQEENMAEQEKTGKKRCYNCANCDNSGFRDICKSCDPKTNDKWESAQSEPEEGDPAGSADMVEVVIRLSKEDYNYIREAVRKNEYPLSKFYQNIADGTMLPKGTRRPDRP